MGTGTCRALPSDAIEEAQGKGQARGGTLALAERTRAAGGENQRGPGETPSSGDMNCCVPALARCSSGHGNSVAAAPGAAPGPSPVGGMASPALALQPTGDASALPAQARFR